MKQFNNMQYAENFEEWFKHTSISEENKKIAELAWYDSSFVCERKALSNAVYNKISNSILKFTKEDLIKIIKDGNQIEEIAYNIYKLFDELKE